MEDKSLELYQQILNTPLEQFDELFEFIHPSDVLELINDDEIEIGMGIHGEPGIQVRKMMTADEVASLLVEKILNDMPIPVGDEVSVMINGLGATPLEEQLIVFRAVYKLLTAKGIKVYMPHIGEFATSMEMAGLSVTIFHLDQELKHYLQAPASTPFYTNANK